MYEQVEKPKENKSRTIANSVAQKKSNEKQSFGFVDNRPETIVQRRMQTLSNGSSSQPIQKKGENTFIDVIQRVVAIGESKENMVIAAGIPKAVEQAGVPVAEWDATDLDEHEKIAIVAHGNVNSITMGGKVLDGETLAEELVKKNIIDNALVFLWSCQAGVRQEDGQKENSSLVEQTVRGLGERGKNGVKVQGFKGIHFNIGADGSSRIINPELTGGKDAKQLEYFSYLVKLNIHFVVLSGYFSQPYMEKFMPELAIQEVEGRDLNLIPNENWPSHRKNLTQKEFMEKEILAHDELGVEKPEWLNSQELFNAEKKEKWEIAGNALITDEGYNAIAISDLVEENIPKMVREAVSKV